MTATAQPESGLDNEAPARIDDHRSTMSWPIAFGGSAAVVAAAIGFGELTAAVLDVPSPLAAVATDVIDAVPKAVKDFAISTFGTADKTALGIGIFVLLVATGAWLLRAAVHRPRVRIVGVAAFTAIGLFVVDVGSDGPGAVVPTAVAVTTAGLGLWLLRRGDLGETSSPLPKSLPEPSASRRAEPMVRNRWQASVDRRQFVTKAAALSATGVTAGLISRGIAGAEETAVRAGVRLPAIPRTGPAAAPTVASGTSVGNGVAPYITPADEFYRIDTAFVTPSVDLATWRLRIDGKVDRPLSLSFDDLLDRDVVERIVTLSCVSNEVGGDLVGNAKWLGIPLAALLDEAGVRSGGDQIAMTSVDGWTCGFPTKVAMDGRDAMLAIGMNGEPLPVRHGFPARIVVPGLYGYVSATKWIERIELTGWDEFDGYWIPRGWAKEAPIKTQSRIDVPRRGRPVQAGTVAIAGVAWAPHRGIERVEVQIDDGAWSETRLGDEPSIDGWRQWIFEWDATPGEHRVRVRATDGDGDTQTGERTTPDPDGATGWHTVTVQVD